jgi:hypothetical protein
MSLSTLNTSCITIEERLNYIETCSKKYSNVLPDIQNLHNVVKDRHSIDLYNIMMRMNGILCLEDIQQNLIFRLSHGKLDNKQNLCLKLSVFRKDDPVCYKGRKSITHPENVEIIMMKFLSQLVINKQTPHIILPLACLHSTIKPCIEHLRSSPSLPDNHRRHAEFLRKYDDNMLHDKTLVIIYEWCDKKDLYRHLFKNNKYERLSIIEWKVLFFQILHTLAIIQTHYPKFRHNNLKPGSILLSSDNSQVSIYKYILQDKTYFVPNIGLSIKLSNFDFSCIPNIIENDKVNAKWTKEINISKCKNQYSDVHYFFNTLIHFLPNFKNHVDQEINDFIDRVVPSKYRTGGRYVNSRHRILFNIKHTTPLDIIIQDSLFDEFRESTDGLMNDSSDDSEGEESCYNNFR